MQHALEAESRTATRRERVGRLLAVVRAKEKYEY
jgi:hypothetical protein